MFTVKKLLQLTGSSVVITTTTQFKGKIQSLLFNQEFQKQYDCTFFVVVVKFKLCW